MSARSARHPRSPEHVELGQFLKSARLAAGVPTRGLGYSAGHVSNVENGHVTASQDLLEAYVRVGADRLQATLLLERVRRYREPPKHSSDVAVAPAHLETHMTSHDVTRHYAVKRYHAHFRFSDVGSVERVVSTVRIVALSHAVQLFYTGHSSDASLGRPLKLAATALSGGVVERTDTGPTGASDIYFRLARPLDPADGEYEFSFQVDPSVRRLSDAGVVFQAQPHASEYGLSVRFHARAEPADVWWFASPDTHSASVPRPDNRVAADLQGVYGRTFDHVVPGWLYGLIWAWPPQLLED